MVTAASYEVRALGVRSGMHRTVDSIRERYGYEALRIAFADPDRDA